MFCCVELGCFLLSYVVLHCLMLCGVALCIAVHCVVLWCCWLCCARLCYVALCSAMLCYAVLCCVTYAVYVMSGRSLNKQMRFIKAESIKLRIYCDGRIVSVCVCQSRVLEVRKPNSEWAKPGIGATIASA